MTCSCHYDSSMSQATLWKPVEAQSEAPLAGMRIVDMADDKGETCGRFLSDLGADVIRVEPPGGARSRRLPHSFAVRNANKRGVTLDLAAPADRERLRSLLDSADVWIETTRPGTLAALGLGPDHMLARNAELVITSITAFGTASVSRASAFPSTRGRPEAGLYPIFPCADGAVRVVVLAPRQWRAMRAWLGEPAAFQDERYDTIAARLDASAELHELYAALFAPMTKDAIAAEGQARGVPVAPVLSVPDVLASDHFRSRGAFVDAEVAPGVRGRLPSGFCEIDGTRVGFRHRAPEPGEHNDVLRCAPGERPAGQAARPGEPTAM